MKSYYDAHESAYKSLKSQGCLSWDRKKSLEEFQDDERVAYFEKTLPALFADPTSKKALDLGCGTGTTAFFLAQRGFQVTGVDVSETAIAMAKDLAQQQNLKVEFIQGDALELEGLRQKFDLIYDSRCLHCIVLDEDRRRAYQSVRGSLTDEGFFLLDTSTFQEGWDPTAPYPTLRFDENFILWHKTSPSSARGVVEIEGQHWCAQRRFYPLERILQEIHEAGFQVVSQIHDRQNPGEGGLLRMVLRPH
ncbi:MAG: class I SAM-dependent methyltransferase [Bdellovibrionales bacterium]